MQGDTESHVTQRITKLTQGEQKQCANNTSLNFPVDKILLRIYRAPTSLAEDYKKVRIKFCLEKTTSSYIASQQNNILVTSVQF